MSLPEHRDFLSTESPMMLRSFSLHPITREAMLFPYHTLQIMRAMTLQTHSFVNQAANLCANTVMMTFPVATAATERQHNQLG